ncbi:hypothetical protein K505DRAFT_376303 [Melanomma pulvis-pyrius CBS 109.77]|uniref:Uncharacterized protein n=1 Tax=Melanomma pulvis-pyrius CBS 109.77 TaxID=1314802 RepID=A0A6A6X7F5_9PLEO|nr:hypothetical protein K505DRAFT_376303 [Melanomma pulvis-pyrius CBS 109.77]
MSEEQSNSGTPIAVVGFAVKFPQEASSADGFWDLLARGASARSKVPANRYNAEGFYSASAKTGTSSTKYGHFIAEPLDRFDAPFFSISPHEAECMDPQQRWLLETSYHALENAGMSIDNVNGSNTSVYAASFTMDYEAMVRKDLEMPNAYPATGTANSLLSNRISWFYNLKGPSVTVNTACSGGLVALHLACESIRSGEATMGLVCGSNLILMPESSTSLSNSDVLSPDGKCYAFDERANGYSRGEGIACLVIKPLQLAMSHGDPIRAIIRGTGINSNGRTPAITRPSYTSQVELMRNIYRRFQLDPSLTRYIEAHGTGTAIGDAVEAEAIATMFNSSMRNGKPLFVGAVKSNIGHLEASAGLAGLIKAIMVLEHGLIPPNIWFEKASKAIKNDWNLSFPTELTPWPGEGLRRASIGSFGFGGTNAHAVIDGSKSYLAKIDSKNAKSNPYDSETGSSTPKLLVLSSTENDGLNRMQEVYYKYFNQPGNKENQINLDSLAYTLAERRSHLSWRSFAILNSNEILGDVKFTAPTRMNSQLRICYVFTGQGAQWASMGKELLCYDIFRQSLENSDAVLAEMGCQFSVLEQLHRERESSEDAQLNATEFCQPICTALQIALVELLADWTIKPSAVVGHSSGEIAAAFCAGIISKTYALKLAFFRGLAVAATSQMKGCFGGMTAVRSSSEKCERLLLEHPHLSSIRIACYNSPHSITLSGEVSHLDHLESILKAEGILSKRLNVDVAYHNTEYMQEASNVYRSLLEGSDPKDNNSETLSSPSCPMVSSVSGKLTNPGSDDFEVSKVDYWLENLVRPVLFTEAMTSLAAFRNIDDSPSCTHFVEIGPHSTLKSAIREILPHRWNSEKFYSSVLTRQQSALLTSMTMAGRLHCQGYPIDLGGVNKPFKIPAQGRPEVMVHLPPYPFNRSKSHWLESRISKNHRFRKYVRHEFLGTPAPDWNNLEPQWNNRNSLREKPFLRDHKIAGVCLYPASGMLIMAIEGSRQLHDIQAKIKGFCFHDVTFSKSIIVPESREGIETQLRFRKLGKSSTQSCIWYDFVLYAYEQQEWSECCRGSIGVEFQRRSLQSEDFLMEEHVRRLRLCCSEYPEANFYANLCASGLIYGPLFQSVKNIRHDNDGHGIASVDTLDWTMVENNSGSSSFLIHPAALDCIFQVGYVCMTQGGQVGIPTLVPSNIRALWISADSSRRTRGRSTVRVSAQSFARGARNHAVEYISLYTDDERPLLVGDVTFTSIGEARSAGTKLDDPVSLFHLEWKPDVDLLSSGIVLDPERRTVALDLDSIRLKDYICYKAMKGVLNSYNTSDLVNSTLKPHLRKYLTWMRHHIEQMETSEDWLQYISEQSKRAIHMDEIYRQVACFGPEGTLIVRLSNALLQIVKGEADPLQLLFADKTLSNYYCQENPPREVVDGVIKYVDLMAHSNPNLRILEIGAGTGGMTREILKTLGGLHAKSEDAEFRTARYSEYMFTDISPAFFKNAVTEFGTDSVLCRTLNIEKEPGAQGFNVESFDLVIASNVLHATQCLSTTLHNARKLLRPGGKMILIEGLSPHLTRLSFIFGCLPGWWRSTEAFRQLGPLVPVQKWDELLRESQFSGTGLVINGPNESESLASAIITTAIAKQNTVNELVFIRREESTLQRALTKSLEVILKESGSHVDVVNMNSFRKHTGAVYVILSTLDDFVFNDPPAMDFNFLKLLPQLNHVLWVWQKNNQDAVPGFCRSIMSENEDLNIVTLGLEDASNMESAAQHISTVIRVCFNNNPDSGIQTSKEEILEIDGALCVGRLLRARNVERTIENLRRHSIHTRDSVTDTLAHDDEIEIEMKAPVDNFRNYTGDSEDTVAYQGFCGTIVRVGASVSKFSIGDRVVSISNNNQHYATHLRCPEHLVRPIPEGFDHEEVALMSLNSMIAYETLINCGRVQKQDSILILGGNRALTHMSIQVAQFAGANVFVQVESEQEAKFISDSCTMPHSHVLHSSGTDLTSQIDKETSGNGIDLLLVTHQCSKRSIMWECLARYGRVVEVLHQHIVSSDVGSALPLSRKSIMRTTVGIIDLLQDRERATKVFDMVLELMKEGKIFSPKSFLAGNPSDHEAPIAPIGEVRIGQADALLKFRSPSSIKNLPTPLMLNHHGTYLITGGLGGLGQNIARWMASRGAKNLMLLSRQGKENKTAASLLADLNALGVNVFAPKCDISDEKAVTAVFQHARAHLPPLKGWIQASMVLNSAMFQNMSLKQWTAALQPKATGTLNIQSHIPASVDFTILLSSVCGIIGASGQSNYAFACAYQDALARQRAALEERTISIDLAVMQEVGYSAENQSIASFMQSLGLQSISPGYLHAMLEYYCDTRWGSVGEKDAQIIAGIMTEEEMQRGNIVRPRYLSRPLFRHLQLAPRATTTKTKIATFDSEPIVGTPDPDPADNQSAIEICKAICKRLSETLSIALDEIDATRPLHTYGVESLVAIEIRSWFRQVLNKDVPIFDILGNGSIEVLAAKVVNGSAK